MSGHCIDCHWADVVMDDAYMCPPTFLSCTCPAFVFGSTPKQYAALTQDGVLAENTEGWGMYVGPKFGCVHWMLPIVDSATQKEPTAK